MDSERRRSTAVLGVGNRPVVKQRLERSGILWTRGPEGVVLLRLATTAAKAKLPLEDHGHTSA